MLKMSCIAKAVPCRVRELMRRCEVRNGKEILLDRRCEHEPIARFHESSAGTLIFHPPPFHGPNMILRRHIEQSHYTHHVLFSFSHLYVVRNTRSGTWCDCVALAKHLHVTTAKASQEILLFESTVGRLKRTIGL